MSVLYEFRVAGELDAHWPAWLGDVELVAYADGTSILRGWMADQAQLHGVLAGLRDLGATLLALTALPPERRPRSCGPRTRGSGR